MYGVVPKTMWEKLTPADSANRVSISCNLLLIETPHGRVLVETGMGPRWTEKEKERFELSTLIDHEQALRSVGIKNEQVDYVLLSHLHFDHAGGSTLLKDGKLQPTFPNAKYYAQKGEWEFAHKANARARASYRLDDFEPLMDCRVLNLVEGDHEIVPGVQLKVTGGHTSHHQVVSFESGGKKGVYFADIIPTSTHLPPSWVMGYDHHPLASCDIKSELLSQAADENWLVVFDHEPSVPWGYVHKSSSNKFDWEPLPADTISSSPVPV